MMIGKSTFLCFDGMWGPHSIDRFADNYNSHLPRLNSRCMPRCRGCRCFYRRLGWWEEQLVVPATWASDEGCKTCQMVSRMLPVVSLRGRSGATLFKGDEPNNFMLVLIIYGTVSTKIAPRLKCYKNASRLNRYNIPTDNAIDFLISTHHNEMV